MDTAASAGIADRWIAKWAAPKIADQVEEEDDLDWDIPRKNPRLCLDSIVEVLSRIPADPADKHFQVLAAGPLEDLLVHHGPAVVDEIDTLARRSPAFRLLLNGVWTSRVDASVVERLARYRHLPW